MKLQKAMEQYEEWLQLPIKRLTRPVGCFKTQKYADTILFRTKQANERIEYDTIEQYKCDAYNKLGQLEDIEERLGKYKEIGINGLIDLFNKLTDDDIEYIVQLVFKKKGDIIMR